MALRILSWNVEHFKGSSKVEPVANLIKKVNPDVFALYKVENLDVLRLMRNHFPAFSFQITDGPEVQEILVGYRNMSTYQATFTQKREFKAYNPALRPGTRQGTRHPVSSDFRGLNFSDLSQPASCSSERA